MKRRQFLSALGATAVTATISGCSSVNPLDNTPTPPTDNQLEYIEYYPHYTASDETIPTLTISMSKDLVIYPSSFGGYTAFEVYKVQPAGSGSQIGELSREEYHSENPPGHTPFSKGTVRGGTVLLILCRTASGEKYTYGAYAEIDDSLSQLAYTSKETPTNNTSG